jgi:hypothetical protein
MQPGVTAAFAVSCRHAPYHFDIAQGGDGLWHVADRDGLVGGTFRRREDALRFAASENDQSYSTEVNTPCINATS